MKALGLEAKKEEPEPPLTTKEHSSRQAPDVPAETPRPTIPNIKKVYWDTKQKMLNLDLRYTIKEK